MTDPTEIARRIGKYFDWNGNSEQVNTIAAALREYGEAECKRVLAKNDEWYHKLLTDVRREAQAEYDRGIKEGWADRNVIALQAHEHRVFQADAEGFARGNEQGYRRGLLEGEERAYQDKLRQRGQEGGE